MKTKLAKIEKFLKNRVSDIILIVAVFLVFFLTGKNNSNNIPAAPQIEKKALQAETNAETPIPNANSPIAEIPTNVNGAPVPVTKMFPETVPNVDPNSAPGDALAESMKNLKGNDASANDLVNRNAYFNKLSQQLNQLQGQGSSDEVGTNSKSDEADEDEDTDVDVLQAEPDEVDEPVNDNQQTSPPPPANPYIGLDNPNPPSRPLVVE